MDIDRERKTQDVLLKDLRTQVAHNTESNHASGKSSQKRFKKIKIKIDFIYNFLL